LKYSISFFLTLNVFASPIRLFHEQNPEKAQIVKQIFIGDYKIPEELIAIKPVGNCGSLSKRGKLDLCLKNNGDLIVVSVDRGFVSESLKIFQAP
jgi:hypothetical protein